MKKKIVFLFLFFICVTLCCFSQGLICDVDFGCWIADWRPTLPPPGADHAPSPATIKMFAYSSWTDGTPAPINWDLQIESFDCSTNDCYINGCHRHPRVFDASDYQHMVASIGGICSTETFGSSIQEENIAYFEFNIAKPEASGTLSLRVKASIPPGCIRSKILEYNPGWNFENGDPNSDWIVTTITLPYHILGLQELPDGTDYLKSSGLSNHVAHQFYATPGMIEKLQKLATEVRTTYQQEGGGYLVKISFNDLSLEYGGIFDYHSTWDPPHQLHREGKSVDLNSRICLQCDEGQTECSNKSSSDEITLRKKDGTTKTLTVKAWIDEIAKELDLHEWELGTLIHLDLVPIPRN